jgi:dTDP-4-amino-4,6-dideoxygalactose transaminase
MNVRCLVPDLPSAEALLPYLRSMDAARWYTNFGPLVQRFEADVRACLFPAPPEFHVVTLSNATAALEMTLAALALPAGSRVLLPAFTFPATATAVLRAGLVPVLADVDATTWTLTPELARAALPRAQPALVVPVAAFGAPLAVDEWERFTDETGVPVLIDAAAALGNLTPAGRTAAVYSLHATKPFGVGEGGLLVTADGDLAEQVRRLSNFGFQRKLIHQPGSNAKLSELAAAVGLAQLERWPACRARRLALWRDYRARLGAVPGVTLQQLPEEAAPANVVIRSARDGEQLLAGLAQQGIEARRWYCPPLHLHPAFAACLRVGPDGSLALPMCDALARDCIGLPFHPFLNSADLDCIVRGVAQLLGAP